MLSELSVVLVTTTPLWAYALTFVKTKKFIEWAIILGVVLTAITLSSVDYEFWKVSPYTIFYALYAIIYMFAMSIRFGWNQPLRNFGYALILVFIAADLWELPVFVLGGLGVPRLAPYFDWFYQIHHLYILAVFVLFVKTTQFKVTWKTAFFVGLTMLCVTVCIWYVQDAVARLLTLVLWGITIVEGLPNERSMVGV